MLIYIKKVDTWATKAELKAKQNKTIKLQAFDSCYFQGKINFGDDGGQNHSIF